MKTDLIEEGVLRWPENWERTRIRERKPQSAWKRPYSWYRDMLVKELERLGAISILITRADNERLDPGVSVWFSRAKQDFSWQTGLGFDNPAPTLDEIDVAFRARAQKCHPDRPDGGDLELFKRLGDYRRQARAWVMGRHEDRHEYVVPCDRFNEAKLNMAALRLAFQAFRSLERVGVPAILERSLGGVKSALPMHASEGGNHVDANAA